MTHSGLFVGMSREGSKPVWQRGAVLSPNTTKCDRCGWQIAEGDWPFCRPDGKHPEDHLR